MRFLITTFSAFGHVNPFLAFVSELTARGHSVIWLCGPRFRKQISATGATFVPWTSPECDADQTPKYPDAGTTGMAAALTICRSIFLDAVPKQVENYQSILSSCAIDVVIADMVAFGVRALAELGGPVWVSVGHNPRITFDHNQMPQPWKANAGAGQVDLWGKSNFNEDFGSLVDKSRAQLGLGPVPHPFRLLDYMTSPYLHLMQSTQAFEIAEKAQGEQLRFVGPMQPIHESGFKQPSWWSDVESNGRYIVHVTQGTYLPELMDSEALVMPAIRALEYEDCIVIATAPDFGNIKHTQENLPNNARVEQFVPHAQLLPFVDCYITNAGYNGTTAALTCGIPIICAGCSEDKADVSRLVEYCGAGINLKTDRPSEEQIRDAVRTIRRNPAYAEEAKRIQQDFAKHDSTKEICDAIEELVRQRSLNAINDIR